MIKVRMPYKMAMGSEKTIILSKLKDNCPEMMIGTSKLDAIENDCDYYQGKLCAKGHRIMGVDGKLVKGTIYRISPKGDICVTCELTRKSMQRKNVPNATQKKERAVRSRTELILEARELGCSVEDLM
jgi:hypothetical protein